MKSKKKILFWINRMLPLALIMVLTVLLYEFTQLAKKEVLYEKFIVASFIAMIVYGVLFGWFLCDNARLDMSRRTAWIFGIILLGFSSVQVLYYTFPIYNMDGILGKVVSVSKYFQIVFGIFVFLIIYQKVRKIPS